MHSQTAVSKLPSIAVSALRDVSVNILVVRGYEVESRENCFSGNHAVMEAKFKMSSVHWVNDSSHTVVKDERT